MVFCLERWNFEVKIIISSNNAQVKHILRISNLFWEAAVKFYLVTQFWFKRNKLNNKREKKINHKTAN